MNKRNLDKGRLYSIHKELYLNRWRVRCSNPPSVCADAEPPFPYRYVVQEGGRGCQVAQHQHRQRVGDTGAPHPPPVQIESYVKK